MKRHFISAAILTLTPIIAIAEDQPQDGEKKDHREAASQVADRQDELAADVQQLTIEQTVPKVIELLTEVEKIMDEATDNLSAAETGGNTLAAQTEVIEKIHEAAKEKQKQKGSGKSGGAMMEMMERMMGKMVIEQLRNKHHLPLNAEQAKGINGLMVKEYMNEFYGRVA